MEFCECGGMMLPSKVNGKIVFKCKCGAIRDFSEEKSGAYIVTKKIEQSVRNEVINLTDIINWKDEYLRSSIKNFKCRSCGYTKAHLVTRQTRSADEGMTHFIICLNCGRNIKIGS